MPEYRLRLTAAFGLAALTLAGCASTGTIDSRQVAAYVPQSHRLLVYTNLGSALGRDPNSLKTLFDQSPAASLDASDENAAFAATLTGTLANCGTQVSYLAKDPSDFSNPLPQAVHAFGPDTILEVQWKHVHYMANQFGGNAQDFTSTYVLQAISVEKRMVVWEADVDFQSRARPGVTLAGLIIDRLALDGLVNASCATTPPSAAPPLAPPAAPAPAYSPPSTARNENPNDLMP